jgi:hypothetical protein
MIDPGADEGTRVAALGLAGRGDVARQRLAKMKQTSTVATSPLFQAWTKYLLAWLDRRPADMTRHLSNLGGLKIQDDPEAMFLQGWLYCDAGDFATGLNHLRRAVARGYFAARTLSASRQFDPVRNNPDFLAIVAQAEAGRQRALLAFREANGERLLGR